MNEYDKLKHEIYIKEKKDKERRRIENFDKDLLKKDINYTTLRETIYQFLRFKKNSNLYKANILKNKIELKLANKISKKNFINKTLKSVMLHFNNIKGRVDLGRKPLEETENEYAYKKIFEQITKSRIKYIHKLKSENEQLVNNKNKIGKRKSFMILDSELNNKDSELMEILYKNLTQNNLKKNEIIKKQNKEENYESNIKRLNENYNSINNKGINKRKSGNICITESTEINNINKSKAFFRDKNKKNKTRKGKKEKKHNYILSEKKIIINNNETLKKSDNNNRTQRLDHLKYKAQTKTETNEYLQLHPDISYLNKEIKCYIINQNNSNNNKFNNYKINKIINKDNIIDNIKSLNENINNQNGSLNKSNSSSTNNKQFIKDLNNLEKMKKNNLIVAMKKKNPIFWNNNMGRVHTAGFRTISNKVKNKPLYTTKIVDLVKEYNRIKTVSNKSRIRMREKHLTTMNDIDKIVKVKEDLLMFNLKLKYFNCSFPQKRIKTIPKKRIIRNKVANCLEIIDNPFHLDYEVDNESSNDN